jgi:hypothetical protein
MDIIIIVILLIIYVLLGRSPLHRITGGSGNSIIFVSAITQQMADKSAKNIAKVLGKSWRIVKQSDTINADIREAVKTGNIVVSGHDLSHSVIDSDIRPDLHIHVSPMPHSSPEELMANKSVIMAALVSGGGKPNKPVDTIWDDYVTVLGKSSINSIIQYGSAEDIREVCETYKFIKS